MGIRISVTRSKEFFEIQRRMHQMAREGLRKEMGREMLNLGRDMHDTVVELLPGRGGLRKFVKYRTISARGRGPASVAATVILQRPRRPYPRRLWDYIIKGTRPHPIVAKRAAALRFYWDKMGKVVFFKSVQHPGTKPYDFISMAFDIVRKKYMDRTAKRMAENAAARLEGR